MSSARTEWDTFLTFRNVLPHAVNVDHDRFEDTESTRQALLNEYLEARARDSWPILQIQNLDFVDNDVSMYRRVIDPSIRLPRDSSARHVYESVGLNL